MADTEKVIIDLGADVSEINDQQKNLAEKMQNTQTEIQNVKKCIEIGFSTATGTIEKLDGDVRIMSDRLAASSTGVGTPLPGCPGNGIAATRGRVALRGQLCGCGRRGTACVPMSLS